MKNNLQKLKNYLHMRETAVASDFILITFILAFLMMSVGEIVCDITFTLIHFRDLLQKFTGNADSADFLMRYSNFFGIWVAFVLFVMIPKKNRPMISILTYRKDGNNFKGAVIGLLLGFLTNGFCILMSVLMGDIVLSFNSFRPGIFFAFLFAVMIQSGGEEIVDRGFVYQKLRRGYRQPWIAIVGNAFLFTVMHLGNDGINPLGITQIVTVAILFSLFVYYYDCMWAAIMMHTGWNFTQSIVFGLPNSGIVSEYSLFKLDAASARNGIFYNVNFGVEGSAGAVVLLVALTVAVYVFSRKRGEKRDLWGEEKAV